MASEKVLITAKLRTIKRQDEIRKLVARKDILNFLGLVGKLDKLFGCKVCHNSCIYIDDNGDRICFSSDEELALALSVLKSNDSLRLEVYEMEEHPTLKEENPSEISTDCSFNSYISHQGGITPQTSSTAAEKAFGADAAATPTKPSLFRSLFLSKLSKQFELSPGPVKRKSTTKLKFSQSDQAVAAGIDTNRSGSGGDVALFLTDGADRKQLARRDSDDPESSGQDAITLREMANALIRIVFWFGNRLT